MSDHARPVNPTECVGMENIVKLARALKVDVGRVFKGVH